jgi:hypothetical protein
MNGVSDTTFDVYGTMTRAMVVTVLYRMENSPSVSVTTSFTDVPASAYYAKAVAWAQQNDIVNGVSETSFDPNDEITQEEFVTILYRYCIYYRGMISIQPGSLSGFSDADDIAYYAKTPFAWLVAAGIIKTEDGTKLRPKDDAIRGQIAVMLTRLHKMI